MDVVAAPAIRFEGMGKGSELWGMTQAYFTVAIPGHHARETAVMLNDPAARMIAEASGQPDSEQLQARAAVAAGTYWLQHLVNTGGDVSSAITVSADFLRRNPDVMDAILAALAP